MSAATPMSLQTNPLLSQWIRVRDDGGFDVFTGKVDIGQGIGHTLRVIAAQSLQCPLDEVHLVPVSTAHSPDEAMTAGSLSVQHSGTALRHACAHARWLLAQSPDPKAHDWQVPVRLDLPLAPLGQAEPVPARSELADLVRGAPFFVTDALPPGTWYGRMVRPSALRFTLNPEALAAHTDKLTRLGVRWQHDGQLLGLIAPDPAALDAAHKHLLAQPLWQVHTHDLSPTDWAARWPTQAAQSQVFHETGEAPTSPAGEVFEGRYVKPFLHHASIGPSAARAVWHSQGPVRLEVWSHSQGIFALRRDLALALDLSVDAVVVHHARHAGCYGHNGADDVAFDAAWLARWQPDTPVFTQWTRADEMACSPVGAGMVVNLRVQVDDDMRLLDWTHTLYSQGHSSRPGRAATPALLGGFEMAAAHPRLEPINMPAAVGAGAERNSVSPYRTAHQVVHHHRLLGLPFRTSSLRGLGAQANVFAIESMVDEVCHARGRDPLAQRIAWLDDPRAQAVLHRVAAMSGWSAQRGQPRAEGTGWGVAYSRYKGTGGYCAVVAEVVVAEVVRVQRLWLAVDIGHVVHASGALLQIEGGALQSTSWTLKEAVQWDEAGLTTLDWERYPILRFDEVPAVAIDLMDAGAHPSLGAGEVAQAPTSAAIANAVFDALGVRVRELPLTPEVIARAM